jgi:predicted GNAT family N-acyltransferase
VEVRLARGRAEIDAALELRERVFCGEQGVSLAAERDGRDHEALHVVAVEDGHVLGTCRVVFDGELGRFGRMAVEPSARRRGIGQALLAEAERHARRRGAARMRLHAQADVQNLYAAGGYVTCGAPFEEEGIPHVTMEKTLA